ncbi:hypothetical protein M7I_7590 [Glarea lozoyensis 74030]|uniref:Uncharacterized protein n=1 Tax=Glarea lozoyensis (strain ATCC 74030 / MF5533) TaxID=1104152 RepID=H0EXQ1_GLAL7|nr:hypothetical protein M7I_7590 [Glarea lozoyensis 74030]
MKKYVVEEREVMEKMCTDWTDEVENDIRLFIATEITSDRDQSTIPNSDSSYRKTTIKIRCPNTAQSREMKEFKSE